MNQNNTTQHYIIFDIDSSSVGTLVFEKKISRKNKGFYYDQIFHTRKNITTGHDLDFDTFLLKTLSTLEDLAMQSHKYSGNNIAGIYVNVSAPWVSSQKRILHYEKDTPFVFTKKIQNLILDQELENTTQKTYDFRDHGPLSVIERNVLSIYTNGYLSRSPYESSVKDVDIHTLVSVMSLQTRQAFQSIIEKYFHTEIIFFSNIYMNYRAFLDLFPQEDDALFIDASGETTEIGLIRKDQLLNFGVIPVGFHGVVRALAQKIKVPYKKAESLIILQQDNHLLEKYQKEINPALSESFHFWLKQVYEFLGKLALEQNIPSSLFLLTPPNIQNWFNESVLKNEEFSALLHTKNSFNILDPRFAFRLKHEKKYQDIADDNLASVLWFVEHTLLKEEKK